MTGISWVKAMTHNTKDKKFPKLEYILNDENINLTDKNQLPLASIRTSLNLNPEVKQELLTDEKGFLFVLKDIPMYYMTEEIQEVLQK